MKKIITLFSILVFSFTTVKGADVHISIINDQFIPGSVNVNVGDVIIWTLNEGVHTTSSSSVPPGAATWNELLDVVGQQYSYTVTVAGLYEYECLLHPGMDGDFTASAVQTTYVWNQTGTASWTDPSSWLPVRNTPATDDILIFNNGEVVTVTNIPVQTIGGLSVDIMTHVTLQAGTSGNILTIDGGSNALNIPHSNSSLNISGSNVLTIFLSTGSTAFIGGHMTFAGGGHRINAQDASSLNFYSTFTQGTGFTGNVFTATGTANVAVFHSGSTFVFITGSNPFGLAQPNSKVVFEPGSLYRHESTGLPAFSGRTYANFELNHAPANLSSTGAATLTIHDITITAGNMNLNLTGTINITGNINVNFPNTLTFTPASAASHNAMFMGSAMQTIGGSGTLTFGPNATITINNPFDVDIDNEVTINGSLVMTSGNIVTSFLDLLILGTDATVMGASDASYVDGPLQKNTNSMTPFTFPTGSGGTLRTIGITPTSTDLTSFVAEYLDIPYINLAPLEPGLEVVSQVDHFILNRFFGTADATVTLEWGSNSGVTNLMTLRVGRWNGAMWVNEGNTATTGDPSGGTVSSNVVSNFSPFALASTMDNPLPVDISSFTAMAEKNNVSLTWTTEWEENNDRFDIQRKVYENESSSWSTVGSVTGAGTTYLTQFYSFIDRNLATGKYEYRLVQFDLNGQSVSDFELNGFIEVGIPNQYELSQNYPNPFNPFTKIDFQLPVDGFVNIKVFDVSGKEVAIIFNDYKQAGYQSVNFDGSFLSSGVYFYRLETASFSKTMRMLLVK